MAHLDVVPVEGSWQHPPFDGAIAGGSIWGRGTLDDKGCVAAVCEAVETLLEDGHVPPQDVWLSFGCDEEVSGSAATLAVDELERRGVRPWFVLDEGGAIAIGAFPGVTAPVGVIGVTEKGVTSVELRVEGRGGHASTPARMGPTARLARAITRIDRSPMPALVPEPTVELLRRLAPHAPPVLRTVLANAGRLGPVLTRALVAAGPESAAMTRTTFAVTKVLVGALELAVIVGALTAGALVGGMSMNLLLTLPAIAVTLCLFAVWFGVEDVPGEGTGGFDRTGLALVTLALGLVMAGLVVIRLDGPGSVLAWVLIGTGVAAFVPFGRHESARPDPMVDVRCCARPASGRCS